MNPVSGTTEIRTDEDAVQTGAGYSEEEVRSRAAARAAQMEAERIAEQQAAHASRAEDEPVRTPEPSAPSGPALAVTAQPLIDQLALDRTLAERAVAADDIALQALIDDTKGWQGTALIALATGTSLEDVRASYFTGVSGGSAVGTPSGTEDVIESLSAEKSQA